MELRVKSKGEGWAREGSFMCYPCWWKHDMELKAEGNIRAGPASGMCASV